jgi:hypothetical protein
MIFQTSPAHDRLSLPPHAPNDILVVSGSRSAAIGNAPQFPHFKTTLYKAKPQNETT